MIAKGKLKISKEEFSSLVGLPEGVEVLAVRAKEYDDCFEFLIASAEEIQGITMKDVPIGQLRAVSPTSLVGINAGLSIKKVAKEIMDSANKRVDW